MNPMPASAETLSAAQIRAIRHGLGLSRRAFAVALGFTGKNAQDNIFKLETGKRRPSEKTTTKLKELANAHS